MPQSERSSKRAPGRPRHKIYPRGRQARNIRLSTNPLDPPTPFPSNPSDTEGALVLYDKSKTENLVTSDKACFMRLNRLPNGISPYCVLQCIKCHQAVVAGSHCSRASRMETTSPGTNRESARLVWCTGECYFSQLNRFQLKLFDRQMTITCLEQCLHEQRRWFGLGIQETPLWMFEPGLSLWNGMNIQVSQSILAGLRQQVKYVYYTDGSTYAGVSAHSSYLMMKGNLKEPMSEMSWRLLRERKVKRNTLIVGTSAERMSNWWWANREGSSDLPQSLTLVALMFDPDWSHCRQFGSCQYLATTSTWGCPASQVAVVTTTQKSCFGMFSSCWCKGVYNHAR